MSHSPFSVSVARVGVVWSDTARRAAFDAWLAGLTPVHGLLPATLRLACADASFRRYLRVQTHNGASLIVMDAPPHQEDCRPFVDVQALLHAAGVRVPHILAWDEAQGFMLLTDLGNRSVIECLDVRNPEAARGWYLQAVDVLIDCQRHVRAHTLPLYDAALLRRELQLFVDWYVGNYRGVRLDTEQQTVLAGAFETIIAHNLAVPRVFVHRDFMMRNLMAGAGMHPCIAGLLDFQDAVLGPVTYDIASLLRDAFISWEEEFIIDISVRYWEKARHAGIVGGGSASGWGMDFGEFYRAVDWMALQRHLKVAGIFARLTLRDGKPKYLADTPRFIRYICQTAGRYRELTALLRVIECIEGVQPTTSWAFGRV